MTDPLRAVLHSGSADLALLLDQPHVPEAIADRLRAWSAVHAHYFPPCVPARAAELIASTVPPSAHRVLLTRDEVMAWLHLAAR